MIAIAIPVPSIPKSLKRHNVYERRRAISRFPKTGNRIRISAETSRDSLNSNPYRMAMKAYRKAFTREISSSNDQDISLSKVLLYIAAEDEAFNALNKEIDARAVASELSNRSCSPPAPGCDTIEDMPLEGKTLVQWSNELDAIAQEVRSELANRDIGCDMAEVLDAVNTVIFEQRGFTRAPVFVDSKHSYLHSVLSTKRATAVLLSVVYMEVCKRISVDIIGSRVGQEFLIWPQTEILFSEDSRRSLLATVNGSCATNPKSRRDLKVATKRDIIGMALADLLRVHWKRASRSYYGLMLTSPLRHAAMPLLRSQDLRLAMMATERLLILQPHNWVLRRDHGMMRYYARDYVAAVQELSICFAFAPEDEVQILEPFLERLHLLRLESSWMSPFDHLPVS